MKNSTLVADYIEQIWNNRAFEKLDNFLHPEFTDHSLPSTFSKGKDGTQKWIIVTGLSFEHNTVIEDQVMEGDIIMMKVKMHLKHIGVWRGIESTTFEIQTTGYRHFKFKDGKIVEHWALIDGQVIENQLKNAMQGCKVPDQRSLPTKFIEC